ncbi:MAG: phosphoribosyltransferase family protein [Vulcanimicrobiota bacterium]
MDRLLEHTRREARYLGEGIVLVDSFLNHQVEPELMSLMGRLLALGFEGVDRVLTAETSGLLPAFAAAQALGVPMVFARKRRLKNLTDEVLGVDVLSRTAGETFRLSVSRRYLPEGERVLVVDDFLARGNTLVGLLELCHQARVEVAGLAVVFEKPFEGGREKLGGVEVRSLITIELDGDEVVFR